MWARLAVQHLVPARLAGLQLLPADQPGIDGQRIGPLTLRWSSRASASEPASRPGDRTAVSICRPEVGLAKLRTMKVLVAMQRMQQVGGTETYALTVAEQLQRLGHQVRIHAHELGDDGRCSPASGRSTW